MDENNSYIANRMSTLEGRVAVCESRIESEKGTLVRMEERIYGRMNELHDKLDANRNNTDEKYQKLSKLVYIGYGALVSLQIGFEIIKVLSTHKP